MCGAGTCASPGVGVRRAARSASPSAFVSDPGHAPGRPRNRGPDRRRGRCAARTAGTAGTAAAGHSSRSIAFLKRPGSHAGYGHTAAPVAQGRSHEISQDRGHRTCASAPPRMGRGCAPAGGAAGPGGCRPGVSSQLSGCDGDAVLRPSQRTASRASTAGQRGCMRSRVERAGRCGRRLSRKESRWPRPPRMVRTENTTRSTTLTTVVALTDARAATVAARVAPTQTRMATAARPVVRPGKVPPRVVCLRAS